MKNIYFYISLILFIGILSSSGFGGWFADLETGVAFSGYNNVRIPGDTGTEFSLSKDLNTDPALIYRVRLGVTLGSKHTLSLFAAPLTIKASGRVNKPIFFFEENFPADTPLDGLYRFNSYRLTYRYDFIRKKKLRLGLGFTAKIRDAAISIEGDGKKSNKTNVGFVPLINFRFAWFLSDKWSLLLDGDALGAPQGRAEDVLLALRLHIKDGITIKAGYRIIEGGANVDEVYNFALIHFLVAGVTFHF
jgi:hypothetical protein